MAIKRSADDSLDLLDDMDIEVELRTRDENPQIASYIVELLQEHKVLHWRELMQLVRRRYTVSVERLQTIVRDLVYSNRIVELPCRFFTLLEIWGNADLTSLIGVIEKKVQKLGLSRCSPPLASAKHPIKIRISRTNKENKLTILHVSDYFQELI